MVEQIREEEEEEEKGGEGQDKTPRQLTMHKTSACNMSSALYDSSTLEYFLDGNADEGGVANIGRDESVFATRNVGISSELDCFNSPTITMIIAIRASFNTTMLVGLDLSLLRRVLFCNP